MEILDNLNSGSSPKILKAATQIIKEGNSEFCDELTNALDVLLPNPKTWKTQSVVIRAIGISNCTTILPFLISLTKKEFDSTVLYKELAFSISIIEYNQDQSYDFLNSTFSTDNQLLISGSCAALLYLGVTPKHDQIVKILNGISSFTENEGAVITPRTYIAALAYKWPQSEELTNFLQSCQQSNWAGLKEISTNSLDNKQSKIKLI